MKRQILIVIERIKTSSFLKNIIVIMSGTALGQILSFVLTPIVSRLFSPTDFGLFGSFNAVAGIITAGVTLEYSQAIMLPKEKKDAINLFILSIICIIAVCLLCLLIIIAFPKVMNGLMKTSGVWPPVLLVLSVFVTGLNQSCQAWAVRAKAFKRTSISQVVRSLSSNGLKIGFGYLKAGSFGLIISNILANLIATVNLVRVVLPDLTALRERFRWDVIKKLASDYRDFPIYSASQNMINALSAGLPVLLLTRFYGIDVAGSYAFGIIVLHTPMALVTTALRQVLFQKACESQQKGDNLSRLYVRTTATLFALSFFPSLLLIVWAPQFFSIIFGARWFFAGELTRSLVIWLAISFCNLPAVLFARVIRIQRFVLFYDIFLMITRLTVLVLGGNFFNVYKTVMIFALVGAIMNAYLIYHVGHKVMKKEGSTR